MKMLCLFGIHKKPFNPKKIKTTYIGYEPVETYICINCGKLISKTPFECYECM